MKGKVLRQTIRLTSPVFFGYIAIGIAFGLLVVNKGYPWWLAPATGVLMFTGTGQFFGIGLFAAGAGLGEILLVELLLSIRHIFYGLSLIGKYKETGKYKPYLVYAMTDETFALVISSEPPEGVKPGVFYTLISLLDQSYWVLGSTIGAVAYSILEKFQLSQYLEGVDFALTALFVVLLMEQLKERKNIIPAIIGLATCAVTVILYMNGMFASNNIIWVSICFGLGVMLLFKGPSFFREEKLRSEENGRSESGESSAHTENAVGEEK